jgi:hypothetical protein
MYWQQISCHVVEFCCVLGYHYFSRRSAKRLCLFCLAILGEGGTFLKEKRSHWVWTAMRMQYVSGDEGNGSLSVLLPY